MYEENTDFSKLSRYECPDCGHQWENQWNSFYDDSCEACGCPCSPYDMVDLDTDKKPHKTVHVKSVVVIDPDTKAPVNVEIRKDMETGAMIGLDSSHLEQDISNGIYYDPYNEGEMLFVPDDE